MTGVDNASDANIANAFVAHFAGAEPAAAAEEAPLSSPQPPPRRTRQVSPSSPAPRPTAHRMSPTCVAAAVMSPTHCATVGVDNGEGNDLHQGDGDAWKWEGGRTGSSGKKDSGKAGSQGALGEEESSGCGGAGGGRVRFDHVVALLLRLTHHLNRSTGWLVPEAHWQRCLVRGEAAKRDQAKSGVGGVRTGYQRGAWAGAVGVPRSPSSSSAAVRSVGSTPRNRAMLGKIEDLLGEVQERARRDRW